MANKTITAETLEYFKAKQDTYNALTFLAQIVYPTLPDTYNYEGRLAFPADEGRLYIYTEDGWKKFAYTGEGGSGGAFEYDTEGNIVPREVN